VDRQGRAKGKDFALPWVGETAFARRALVIALTDRAAASALDGWVFLAEGSSMALSSGYQNAPTSSSMCWRVGCHRGPGSKPTDRQPLNQWQLSSQSDRY
jgi:hypothetical protein